MDLNIWFEPQNRVRTALVAVIIVLIVGGGIITPLRAVSRDLAHAITIKQLQYERDSRAIAVMQQSAEIYEHYKGLLDRPTGAKDEEVAALFLKETEESLRVAGMSIVDMKILPLVTRDAGIQFMVETQIEVTMDQLVTWLHMNATAQNTVTIEELSIERKTAASDVLSVHLVLGKVTLAG